MRNFFPAADTFVVEAGAELVVVAALDDGAVVLAGAVVPAALDGDDVEAWWCDELLQPLRTTTATVAVPSRNDPRMWSPKESVGA